MKKIVSFLFVGAVVLGCSSVWEPTPVCPGSELDCGGLCYDPSHYACENSVIVLVSCNSGYQMCGGSCVPFPSMCCQNNTYCFEKECCGNGCIPPLTVCCPGGRWCPLGKSCSADGTQCF